VEQARAEPANNALVPLLTVGQRLQLNMERDVDQLIQGRRRPREDDEAPEGAHRVGHAPHNAQVFKVRLRSRTVAII